PPTLPQRRNLAADWHGPDLGANRSASLSPGSFAAPAASGAFRWTRPDSEIRDTGNAAAVPLADALPGNRSVKSFQDSSGKRILRAISRQRNPRVFFHNKKAFTFPAACSTIRIHCDPIVLQ